MVLLALRLPFALLMALVLAAGPAVGAVCEHAGGDPMGAHHGMEGHGVPDEAPPCHGEPPAPAPVEDVPPPMPSDCASACCASEAPVRDVVVVSAGAAEVVPAPLAVTLVRAAPEPAPIAPTASPPGPSGSVRVAIQQFLI